MHRTIFYFNWYLNLKNTELIFSKYFWNFDRQQTIYDEIYSKFENIYTLFMPARITKLFTAVMLKFTCSIQAIGQNEFLLNARPSAH